MACLCDFCSAPNAGWRHPARSFIGYVAPGVVGESAVIGRHATNATN
jgi:hypothetical protein